MYDLRSSHTFYYILTHTHQEARGYLEDALVASRELVQHAVVFTRRDRQANARHWRAAVARRVVVLLRGAEAVLEKRSKGMGAAWMMIPELTAQERIVLHQNIPVDQDERCVDLLTLFLRTTLLENDEYLDRALTEGQTSRLLTYVDRFVNAYHGMLKNWSTPFPFPMVQMARFLLLVWIYTLPFALVNVITKLAPLLILIFFITFGFVGLEQVSIELDDPYGDDDGDIPLVEFLRAAYDDIALSLMDVDGHQGAQDLEKSLSSLATTSFDDDDEDDEENDRSFQFAQCNNEGSSGNAPPSPPPPSSMTTPPYDNKSGSFARRGQRRERLPSLYAKIPPPAPSLSDSTNGSMAVNETTSLMLSAARVESLKVGSKTSVLLSSPLSSSFRSKAASNDCDHGSQEKEEQE